MADFTRAKRVTDLLHDKVKARLVGVDLRQSFSYISSGSGSGSEHSADDSPCLSELVHGFLEDDDSDSLCLECESESVQVEPMADCTDAIENILKSNCVNNAESYRNMLLAHVLRAMEFFSCFRSNGSVFRRKVMSYLREIGYNAAICKSKWEASGGLTAGNYEFIDVIHNADVACQHRYIVDLDFAAEFEIARPTSQYSKLVESLPTVFVGSSEEMKKILRVMCDAARSSLRSRELTIPPWRKNRYMQNKWFGPYRRTTNPVQASSVPPVISPVSTVKYRCVGFDDASANGRLFVRTR